MTSFHVFSETETTDQEKQKTTRRFPLSLTSPLAGRKKSESAQGKTKASAPSSSASAITVTVGTGALGKVKITNKTQLGF